MILVFSTVSEFFIIVITQSDQEPLPSCTVQDDLYLWACGSPTVWQIQIKATKLNLFPVGLFIKLQIEVLPLQSVDYMYM